MEPTSPSQIISRYFIQQQYRIKMVALKTSPASYHLRTNDTLISLEVKIYVIQPDSFWIQYHVLYLIRLHLLWSTLMNFHIYVTWIENETAFG